MTYYKGYEMVIGLEVHAELKTKTKIFCRCKTDFGAEPNTQCCPICMGMPGTLPVLNEKVVDYAIKAGKALGCEITRYSKQDRKNYFYPDLPKAYQISQYDLPLCVGGHVDIETSEGSKTIGITRIHIEEDAGKLIHDETHGTMIDCNRCGVPLIEIVSEPDIRSAEEAAAYLRKLRAVILYTGVSDCKMNEGSLRCDVNLSVRKAGEQAFGTRTEMKNINSFQFIIKAIEYEYKRQVDALESGEKIVQETRRFDANTGKTYTMRSKENANDYRYFPDPDLPAIEISDEMLKKLTSEIPVLPDERKKLYTEKFGLTAYDAEMITAELETADYYEKGAALTKYPKLLANLLISEFFALKGDDGSIKICAENAAKLAELLGAQKINSSTAKKLTKQLWEHDEDPEVIVKRDGLEQINDRGLLKQLCEKAFAENPKSIEDYKKGKKTALKAIIGKVMSETGGKGNPVIINEVVEELASGL